MNNPLLVGVSVSGANGKTTTSLLLDYLLGSNFIVNCRPLLSPKEEYPLLIITNIAHPLPHWQKKETWHRCLQLVKNMGKKGIVLLNADDPHCLALADRTRANVVSFSTCYQQAMVTARDISRDEAGNYSFKYLLEEEIQGPGSFLLKPLTLKITSPLWGEHNLYNTVAAVTAALLLQVEEKNIPRLLNGFPGIRRQGEIKHTGTFTILDDRADTPPALESLMREASRMKFDRLILLTGLGSLSSSANNQQKASVLCSWGQKIPVAEIIFTRGYRFSHNISEEEKGKEEKLLQYFRQSQLPFHFIPEGIDALYAALELTGKNDLLLLAGKGCMEQISELVHSFFLPQGGSPLEGTLNPS